MPTYTLGSLRLDTQHNLLLREGAPVPVGRRAIALLRSLIERPGALVSKDELIEAAWPGRLVEESNLPVQIAALRRVLGETPGGDRWIETMPGRGYRFIGPIVTETEQAATAPPPQVDSSQEPVPTPRADAERRQITAMSCELIGISGGADGVSLEDLRDVVSAFQGCVSEIVDRHDGLVISRLGNAALVLFGYPAAHEYDAERAVRAGLELCAAVRTLRPDADPPMQCRVGIATGMAIIGDLSGDGALQDREVIGDAPNLAGRLQLSIQPGIVAIERATRRLIGNLFDCRDLGTVDTTRSTEPLHIWQVLEDSANANRFEALRGLSLSPLVGRDEEIDVLLRRWASAKAGDGQFVLVSGEPGLGKSRLIAALQESLCAEPHTRLRYQCSPYHRDSVLHPFVVSAGAHRLPCPQGLGGDAAREARSHTGALAHCGNGTALRLLAVDSGRRSLSAARTECRAAAAADPGGLARPARSTGAARTGIDAVRGRSVG
jgi:class 3 adenylate cyclase